MMRALAIMMAVLVVSVSSGAHAVTVNVVGDDFNFVTDEHLEVVVEVDDAQGLTGLEFSIVYPADLLAVNEPSTHELGSLFSHGFVNHDADSSELPAGSRRIAVAFAVAAPVSAESGTLLTLSFPLRCGDYSAGWPEGRPVTIEIQGVAAWKAAGANVPASVAASGAGTTVNVDCTTVPVNHPGFSTLKARHVEGGGK